MLCLEMFLQRRFGWKFSVLFWWIVIANLRNGFCYLLNAVSTKFARLNLPPPPCACLSPTVERPEFL